MYNIFRNICRIFLVLACFVIILALPPINFTESNYVFGITESASNQNIALGKPYEFSAKPNYQLCTDADDSTQLTDGVFTKGYFWTQKSSVGWSSIRPVKITIDLGKIEAIQGASYSTAAGAGGVAWPTSIDILVSDDGKNFYYVNNLVALSEKTSSPPKSGYGTHKYYTNELETHGRYFQLIIDSGLDYCFTDEIEVFSGDSSLINIPLKGEQINNGLDYFKENLVHKSIQKRLETDLLDAKNRINSSELKAEQKQTLLDSLSTIESQIQNLNGIDISNYSSVMPMNSLEAQIFAVIGKMRSLQGAPKLQVWSSNSYDYLTPTQEPASNSSKNIDVNMMSKEVRNAVFNITSSHHEAITAKLNISGLPEGQNPEYIEVYSVEWTDTQNSKPIASALTKVQKTNDGYDITIPAGMVRQVWVSFDSRTINSGEYNGKISLSYEGTNELVMPLKLTIFPFSLASDIKLKLGGWDYTSTNTWGVTNANRDKLVALLQQHLVNSPWATKSTLADGKYDDSGNMSSPSTANFDKWVELWPNAKQYNIFLNVDTNTISDNALFKAKVKSWIDFWVKHAQSKNIAPNQLVLLLVDEPSTLKQYNAIINWAKAIKEAQPNIVIWEDPILSDSNNANISMLFDYVDTICLQRKSITNNMSLLSNYKGQLDIYTSEGAVEQFDPYTYYRLSAWTAWDTGAKGVYFWSFSDNGDGGLWRPYSTRKNYSPIFLTKDSVVSSKHMEAIRESMEDYGYIQMLENAILNADSSNPMVEKAKQLISKELKEFIRSSENTNYDWSVLKDRSKVDTIRLKLLNALVDLGFKSATASTAVTITSDPQPSSPAESAVNYTQIFVLIGLLIVTILIMMLRKISRNKK